MNEIELYHGSNSDFKEFNVAKLSTSLYGWGFNFTTDIELAKDFGNIIYTIELPDDAKLLNIECTDLDEEIYQAFAKDIEEHGISEDFIDKKGMDKYAHTFKEQLWMMQENYCKLLGISRNEAMKRLSDIIKSFGFIGTHYKDIFVIFDRESFIIKDKRKIDLGESFNFSNAVSNVINESLSRLAYHFTTFKKYYQMVDSDSIIFSTPYSVEDRNINTKFGKDLPYYLSTTRIRDGRVGYSVGKNVRLELNSDKFNNNFRAGAVNYFTNSDDRDRDGNNFSKPNVRKTESEDRIFSDEKIVTGLTNFVNRVDILLRLSEDELPLLKRRYYDIYIMLRDIYNTGMGLKTFIYNDEAQFNIQGKNITEEILKYL